MSKSSKKQKQGPPKRTTLQIIALIYVAIHGIIFWLTARSMPGAEDTTLTLSLFGVASLASIIAAVAMWYWKRWGVYLYVVATFVLAGVVLLQTGNMIMFFGAIIPMFLVLYVFSKVFKHFK